MDNKNTPVVAEEIPESVKIIRKTKAKPEKQPLPIVKQVEYEEPYVKVMNIDGEIIRYEDANGKNIPKELWPVFEVL